MCLTDADLAMPATFSAPMDMPSPAEKPLARPRLRKGRTVDQPSVKHTAGLSHLAITDIDLKTEPTAHTKMVDTDQALSRGAGYFSVIHLRAHQKAVPRRQLLTEEERWTSLEADGAYEG